MDVLNTYGGGVDYSVGSIVYGAFVFLAFAAVTVVSWRMKDRLWAIFFAFTAALGLVVILLNVLRPDDVPVRHEITLRPGGVIDATKYEIVEQRGQIYVIEEREVADK